ncbi:MAG TPA: aminotransferase class IV [Myxococcota bacterium]|nr:aminotransferase class IV [Myxococcota bacterium]
MRADDSAFGEGRGCYTSARVEGGVARHAARHARRLARDAATLRLPPVDEERCLRAFAELSRAAFGDDPGIVRLQASRDGAGRPHLVGVPRALGPPRPAWTAVVAPFPHPGPAPWGGAKVTGHLHHLVAREAALAASADEALLFDASGRLVEGARTNLVAVLADGTLVAPPAARGAVAGVALAIVRERGERIVERDLGRDDLSAVRELVALNAVRGAVALVRLDGRAVGDGAPGPTATRLAALLDTEA